MFVYQISKVTSNSHRNGDYLRIKVKTGEEIAEEASNIVNSHDNEKKRAPSNGWSLINNIINCFIELICDVLM